MAATGDQLTDRMPAPRLKQVTVQRSGIVFSGGGARGAYQAGVARGLFEVMSDAKDLSAFRILTGVSAGAINSSFLAAHASDLDLATRKLCDMWRKVEAEQVFRTDYGGLFKNAASLARGVTLGGLSQSLRPKTASLLNTAPLRELLERAIDFTQINKNVESGTIDALTISATDYATSLGVTFVDGRSEIPMWSRATRVSRRAEITVDHVMASSAIPLFFPPVRVGNRYFGDGCLRNTAPLSPAIHAGANHLFVVGVRRWRTPSLDGEPKVFPSLGRVLSILINAILMDAVEADIERLKIINQNLSAQNSNQGFQKISLLYLQPSEDIAEIARQQKHELPRMIRFLIGGLGSTSESAEMISYLLFEPEFCSTLVDLGIRDCHSRKEEILSFLRGSDATQHKAVGS